MDENPYQSPEMIQHRGANRDWQRLPLWWRVVSDMLIVFGALATFTSLGAGVALGILVSRKEPDPLLWIEVGLAILGYLAGGAALIWLGLKLRRRPIRR